MYQYIALVSQQKIVFVARLHPGRQLSDIQPAMQLKIVSEYHWTEHNSLIPLWTSNLNAA